MSTANTYVRARIDSATKERAADALDAMGLSISDAIRLLMLRIADEHRLPFEVKAPSASSSLSGAMPWLPSTILLPAMKAMIRPPSAADATRLARSQFRRSGARAIAPSQLKVNWPWLP